jgi:hypothetical protein
MRELLMGELQDGHALVRFAMLATALCAMMWLAVQRKEKEKPPGDQPSG